MRAISLLLFLGLAAAPALPQAPSGANPSRMEIKVEQKQNGAIRTTDPGHVFAQGDLVRFHLKANFSGFLYVMDQSTSGKYVLLFPKDETGRENRIESGKDYIIPATTDGWFKIEGPAGHEVVYWLVSPTEFSQASNRSAPIPPLPAPRTGQLPPDITPRCDDTIFQARGDCVDTSAGVKPLAKSESLPDNLTPFSISRPEDLIFLRQQNTSMVSSPDPLQGPIIYEFHLAHK